MSFTVLEIPQAAVKKPAQLMMEMRLIRKTCTVLLPILFLACALAQTGDDRAVQLRRHCATRSLIRRSNYSARRCANPLGTPSCGPCKA